MTCPGLQSEQAVSPVWDRSEDTAALPWPLQAAVATQGLAQAVEKGAGQRMHSCMHADLLDSVSCHAMPCHATPCHVMSCKPAPLRVAGAHETRTVQGEHENMPRAQHETSTF